jgi:hypothetical protein
MGVGGKAAAVGSQSRARPTPLRSVNRIWLESNEVTFGMIGPLQSAFFVV